MAISPAHKFGQALGNLLEELVLNRILKPRLEDFIKTRNYYLDWQKARSARPGKKVAWEDKYGNSHDLDFVIEVDGTEEKIGKPIAFIEAAWRRYTKHSKNKAQEIQGALLPIVEHYRLAAPFYGVVLAGEFTLPALEQLRNNRFAVLYISYDQVISAFKEIDFNIAFDEKTADASYKKAHKRFTKLTEEEKRLLLKALVKIANGEINKFMNKLKAALDRYITRIVILPLFGRKYEFDSLADALGSLEKLDLEHPFGGFEKFEIIVDYSNGDGIRASFQDKKAVSSFMKTLED